ncbi:Methyltransferase type 11 [Haladaptatus paucihalophilus DX253]|uniref:Methyltransferase domain-containing protein n=1 Tax=Haladaptatus paucihalophilus DX253 TaxID=797209 RepID=E7QSY0_HALPU|nr:class I SAM-dependent methyltransferase [Haladaptatus paucihalophilus]EFW92369.1 Methyltransferase type 11 [Haladaptatus paucihalophilus DX253]SHL61797.1 Methyltransferase domain-containing protein [Haladaptatus paucihalophilus DX253]
MAEFQNTGQPSWDWWSDLWPTPANVLQQLGITENQSVADVCSGNGYFTLLAASLVDKTPVFAIDIDATLLAELRSRATEQGLENIQLIHGDARDVVGLLPHIVDIVLLANTFHGIADQEAFANDVKRALASNGRFIIVNWYPASREETPVAGEPRRPPTELRLSREEYEAKKQEYTKRATD